ncbi:MAG TPA: hypothetical protein VIU16_14340 [Gaiellaceae bacterium]
MSLLVNSGISSSLVRENVQGSLGDIVFRRTDFLNFLRARGAIMPLSGADPMQWNITYAGNGSAQTYVESQAAPLAGKQSYARASLGCFHTEVVAGYSGHVADQVRNGGVYQDPIQNELAKGIEDLFVQVESTLVGSTADQGVQSIIDGGDTYAGLAPGTYTSWKSLETAVGGALAVSTFEDNLETAALSPYLSQPTDWFMPANQITNYNRLVGTGATTSLYRGNLPMAGGTNDIGMMPGNYLQGQTSYNGAPIHLISGLTTTVILALDMRSPVRLVVKRDVTVKPLAETNDDSNVLITFACALQVMERNKHIKLTGVTA